MSDCAGCRGVPVSPGKGAQAQVGDAVPASRAMERGIVGHIPVAPVMRRRECPRHTGISRNGDKVDKVNDKARDKVGCGHRSPFTHRAPQSLTDYGFPQNGNCDLGKGVLEFGHV